MVRLTRQCQYALRALDVLAREYGKAPVMMTQISAVTGAPREFLQAILLTLKNAGVLNTWRGTRGGYALALPPGKVTLGQVIRIMEGPVVALPCIASEYPSACEGCRSMQDCRIHPAMREIARAVTEVLDSTTLETCRAAARKRD